VGIGTPISNDSFVSPPIFHHIQPVTTLTDIQRATLENEI
jgi:hypothetical protein